MVGKISFWKLYITCAFEDKKNLKSWIRIFQSICQIFLKVLIITDDLKYKTNIYFEKVTHINLDKKINVTKFVWYVNDYSK